MGRSGGAVAGLSLLVLLSACVHGHRPAPTARDDAGSGGTIDKAGKIVTQPVRDVGIGEPEIPPVLEQATADTYGLTGLKSCAQIAAAITELDGVLGPDFDAGVEKKENRAGKIAEAGGKTVVNALIPFRGLVREISGAAPAQRRLNAAIDAGLARRGFLRGVAKGRRCSRSPE